MSQITDAFSELYAAQTEAAAAITASFTTPAPDITGVEVVIGAAGYDDALFGGGIGERGTISIQCLKTALSASSYTPSKTDVVVVSTDSLTRYILNVNESHGVYTIELGDFAAK